MSLESSSEENVEDVVRRLRETSSRDQAISLIKRLVTLQWRNEDTVRILRDRSQDFGLTTVAVKFAKELAILSPSAGNLRVLSGLLEVQGQANEAIKFAHKASLLEPQNFDYALHLGCLYNATGQFSLARQALDKALAIRRDEINVLHNACFAYEKLGEVEIAISLADEAFGLDKCRPDYAILAANLMIRIGQFQKASDYLAQAARTVPKSDSAGLYRTQSGALSQIFEYEAALELIDQALDIAPDRADYHLHRAGVLSELGRFKDAYSAGSHALSLDPGSQEVKRQLITICLELGDSSEATSKAAELLREYPDHDEYAQCMQHVLFQRQDNSIGLGDILNKKREGGWRPVFNKRSKSQKANAYLRVIMAIFLREIRARFGETRLGYLWVVVEPMIHMVALAVVFQFTMKGLPPLGNSFFFFYFTGLIPYQLFVHTTEQVSSTVSQNKSLLQLPPITNLATMYARALLELYTTFIVIILFVVGFFIFSVNAIPYDFPAAMTALLATWVLAIGVGIINAMILAYFHAWHHIFQIVTRFLYFTSGIFYVPAVMPQNFRDILVWNPLLHSVDWFRTAFFVSYQPPWMSSSYLLYVMLCVFSAGLMMEAALRTKLRRVA